MNALEAIRELEAVYALANTTTRTQFTVSEIDTSKSKAVPKPIGIEITGTFRDESAAGLLLLHPDRPFDTDGRNFVLDAAMEISIAVIRELEKKLKLRAKKAAQNN